MRLRTDERGSSLVEFALIAFPLLLLLFGILEIGFHHWATEELENATNDATRLIRTGQVQAGNLNQAQLKSAICSRTALLPDCAGRLRVDVRSAGTFAGIVPPEPLTGDGSLKDDGGFSYAPGVGGDVVLVSTFYTWTPILSGPRVLRAAAPARNEPF